MTHQQIPGLHTQSRSAAVASQPLLKVRLNPGYLSDEPGRNVGGSSTVNTVLTASPMR